MSGIRLYRGKTGVGRKRIFDVFANQTREHLAHLDHDAVQVKDARLQDLHAAECQQLARHGNRAVGGFLNLLEASLLKIVGAFAIDQQIAVPANHRQQIIEIVRHAAREPAHGFHLVGLAQPLFELLLLVLSALHAGAHPEESVGDLGDFISAAAFERIVEVALLQGANAGDQAGKRPRERMRNQENQSAARQDAQQARDRSKHGSIR